MGLGKNLKILNNRAGKILTTDENGVIYASSKSVSDIADLTDNVSTLESTTSALDDRITALEGTTTELENRITGINGEVVE